MVGEVLACSCPKAYRSNEEMFNEKLPGGKLVKFFSNLPLDNINVL